jgi:hypothetical protein
MFQVPRQEIEALLGIHRVAVEAYRRIELPDEIRVLPPESYGVFVHRFPPVPIRQLPPGAVTNGSQSGSGLTKHLSK